MFTLHSEAVLYVQGSVWLELYVSTVDSEWEGW